MLKQSQTTKRPVETERTVILRKIEEFRLHPADNRRVIESFYVALGTPVALSCYLLYKYHEYDQLVTREIDPLHYTNGLDFRDDFAAISFLRKHEGLKTTFDTKKAALAAFGQSELQCAETNVRLRRYLLGCKKHTPDESILNRMIRKIDSILGEFDIDQVLDLCGWGPGSTLSVKGSDTSGAQKFDVDRDITADAYDLFSEVLPRAYPNWDGLCAAPSLRVGNKIITVPKNAKTDRTIAIEPGINSWLQSGIGKSIRKRLRAAGYNLNSDLKNQRGAYSGSLDGFLATIDFKAASDTLSVGMMELILPPRWFQIMNAVRSQYYTLGDSEPKRSEKFSTMGNGFTFELESLVFLALALSITDEQEIDDTGVTIFGDDLVLPSQCVPKLTELCAFLGYTINTSKSFSTGVFRESCGTYYFNGCDVKPLYFKTDLVYVKDLYRMANATRDLSNRFALRSGCDLRFRSIWSLICHFLPLSLRLFGPVSGGDSVIHHNLNESKTWSHKDSKGRPTFWEGYCFTGIPTIPIDINKDSQGLLLSRLKTFISRNPFINEDLDLANLAREKLSDRLSGNKVSLREATRIVYKKSMFAVLWYDFGDWQS